VKKISGHLDASAIRLGIVVSRFNSVITEKLFEAAVDTFERHGGRPEKVTVVRVPGSFEIPIAAQKLARIGGCDAVVCLGCLIRGETKHFDFLAAEVTRAIGEVALQEDLPVSYGVITSETVEQAMNRAGVKHGNKGVEATLAAIEMVNALDQISADE
jgi:6,7-dimethyl-8-ribityllumazine synthase